MEYSFMSCSPAWFDIKIFQDEDLLIESTLCLSNVPLSQNVMYLLYFGAIYVMFYHYLNGWLLIYKYLVQGNIMILYNHNTHM